MTRRTTLAALTLAALALRPVTALTVEEGPSKVYQLRTYTTAPDRLDVLVERFGRVNLPLFQKHGIELVGAWTPFDPEDRADRLVYLVAFPGRDEAEAAWKAFDEDPEWTKAFDAEKQEHGEIVTGVETLYLQPTDYSPTPSPSTGPDPDTDRKDDRASQGDGPRLIELRRYTASPGKLDALNARFRDHTMELFAKHGMTNVLYTTPIGEENGAGEVLVYFLAHASHVMALDSWESFRSDPAWIKARDESQSDGVPLAAKVESTYLKPTEFSPLK